MTRLQKSYMNIGLCVGAILLGFIPNLSFISLVCEIIIMFTTTVGSVETIKQDYHSDSTVMTSLNINAFVCVAMAVYCMPGVIMSLVSILASIGIASVGEGMVQDFGAAAIVLGLFALLLNLALSLMFALRSKKYFGLKTDLMNVSSIAKVKSSMPTSKVQVHSTQQPAATALQPTDTKQVQSVQPTDTKISVERHAEQPIVESSECDAPTPEYMSITWEQVRKEAMRMGIVDQSTSKLDACRRVLLYAPSTKLKTMPEGLTDLQKAAFVLFSD